MYLYTAVDVYGCRWEAIVFEISTNKNSAIEL